MDLAEPLREAKNIVFIVGNSKLRDGMAEDKQKICETFSVHYNAIVYDWADRTKDQYKTLFGDLKKNDTWLERFRQCNFVAIFCLSHGTTDDRIVFKTEENMVLLLKCYFLNPFFSIEQLDGKLKWLIVQSCRGRFIPSSEQTDGAMGLKYLNYFMISYCTSEGLLSYQLDTDGKIFIQYLCNKLTDNARTNYKKSLKTIVKEVGGLVEQYGIDEKCDNFPKPSFCNNFESSFKEYCLKP